MLTRQLIIFLCILSYTSVHAQEKTDVSDSLSSALSGKYLNKIDDKISALNKGIEKKTLKMLKHLQGQEDKIKKAVAKNDSVVAQQLFAAKDHRLRM